MNNLLTQQEIAAFAQEEKYRKQMELVQRLYTPAAFFAYYFEKLPAHRTSVECFNEVNDLHQELFGEPKYVSYKSFQNQLNRHLNK